MGEWISVEDSKSIPFKVIAISVHREIYACIHRNGEFYPYGHSGSEVPVGVVTHWMPLPEPPTKELG